MDSADTKADRVQRAAWEMITIVRDNDGRKDPAIFPQAAQTLGKPS